VLAAPQQFKHGDLERADYDLSPTTSQERRMAKGYWVARIDVSDPDQYRHYVAANAVAFAKFGARFLVRGGAFDTMEGSSRSRNVVIEFPSLQAAQDCYASAEYQAALQLRLPVSSGDLVIVEGYDGPQPG
jgi:uncharacterized protein (DUF1330 family)